MVAYMSSCMTHSSASREQRDTNLSLSGQQSCRRNILVNHAPIGGSGIYPLPRLIYRKSINCLAVRALGFSYLPIPSYQDHGYNRIFPKETYIIDVLLRCSCDISLLLEHSPGIFAQAAQSRAIEFSRYHRKNKNKMTEKVRMSLLSSIEDW